MSEPKYQVGDKVRFESEHLALKVGPREVLERLQDGDEWFYRVDSKNYVHEPMIAGLFEAKG